VLNQQLTRPDEKPEDEEEEVVEDTVSFDALEALGSGQKVYVPI
jgi:hypothetical protein